MLFTLKCSTANMKRFLYYLLFLLPLSTSAQTQSPTGFGLDGDLYPNPDSTFFNEDWFADSSGLGGVIDEAKTDSLLTILQQATNARQRNFGFSWHTPAEILDAFGGLDAYYQRDQISASSAKDSSTFITGASKNADHPDTWQIGLPGTPQKGDIVDVMTLLRHENHSLASDLWFFGSVSTRTPDGNKHLDFEFYRDELSYQAGSMQSQGLAGGRTAWRFNDQGEVEKAGDFILSLDYLNGGTTIQTSIRVWVSPQAFPNQDLTSLNGQLPFAFSGVFDSGFNSGSYGYAEIILPQSENIVIVRANDSFYTAAPPWGTLSGSQGNLVMQYEPMQWVEVAFNFSALGLDASRYRGTDCGPLLGTLLVKSRASQSFTAELKDFTPPMSFATQRAWSIELSAGDISCNSPTIQPQISLLDSSLAYQWQGPQSFQSNELQPDLSLPGTYILQVGPPNGCVLTDTLTISIDTVKPDLQLSAGLINCIQMSTTVQANTSLATTSILWTLPDGSSLNASSINVTEGGWYYATITHPRNGCSLTDSIEVIEDTSVPSIQLSDLYLSCTTPSENASPTISPAGNYLYQWTGAGGFVSNQLQPQFANAGVYTLAVIVPANGCESSASMEVFADFAAPLLAFADDTLNCLDTLIQLNGTITPANNVQISWTGPNGFASNAINPDVSAGGNYQLNVTNLTNGCASSTTVNVEEQNVFAQLQATGGQLSCDQDSVLLTAGHDEPDFQYQWTGPNGFSSSASEVYVQQAGTYTLSVTHSTTHCSLTETVGVSENRNLPQVSLPDSVSINCSNSTWSPSGLSTQYDYQWTGPNAFNHTANSPTFSEGGSYTVIITDPASGCDTLLTIQITADFAAPVVNVQGANITCLNPSTELAFEVNGLNQYTFYWLGPNGFFSQDSTPEVGAGGSYRLYVRNPENGCLTITSISISDQNRPIILSGSGGALSCNTDSVQLQYTAPNGGAYAWTWTGPNGFSATDLSPWAFEAGIYTVQVTDTITGCSGMINVSVSDITNDPPLDISKNHDLNCQYDAVILTAYPSSNYQLEWSNNGSVIGTGSSISVDDTAWYSVRIIDLNTGCEATDSIQVFQNLTVPSAKVSAADSLSCEANSIRLQLDSLSAGTNLFYWYGPGGFSSGQREPYVSQPGTYYLRLTHFDSRCDTTISVEVLGDPTPLTVSAFGGTLNCLKDSVQLTINYQAGLALTFNWTGPNGFTSTEAEPIVTQGGYYRLTAVDTIRGCSDDVYAYVLDKRATPYLKVGSGTLGCEGSSTQLNAQYSNGTYSFQWAGPDSFSSTERSPQVSKTGTYSLTITHLATGCSNTDSTLVVRNTQAPIISLSKSNDLDCYKHLATLYAFTFGSNVQYQWTGPKGYTANTAYPSASEPGVYTISVQDQNTKCSTQDSITLLDLKVVPQLSLADTSLSCDNPTILLDTELEESQYHFIWTGPAGFSSSSRAVTIALAGTYVVEVFSIASGCTYTDSLTVADMPPCTDALCTQTQGFYGSDNGRFCDGRTTRELLMDLLEQDLIIGGEENRFSLRADELDAFFMRMPGGGTSIPLDGIATSLNPVGIPLDNNGQFDNNLLAQTITLGLNLRLSRGLGDVSFANTRLVSLKSSDCQSPDAVGVGGSGRAFDLPASIVNYLDEPTIAGLYTFANAALAGTYVPTKDSPGLGEITGAIGAINDGFNGCRILEEFVSTPSSETAWEVSGYPNPTMGQDISFSFTALESGPANLSIYQIVTGNTLAVPFEGEVVAGETYVVSTPVDNLAEGTYFYLLRVNGILVAQGSFQVYQ